MAPFNHTLVTIFYPLLECGQHSDETPREPTSKQSVAVKIDMIRCDLMLTDEIDSQRQTWPWATLVTIFRYVSTYLQNRT